MKNQNKINDINFLEKFEISELEQRLENRWCTTTITDKDGNVTYYTERCSEPAADS
jgi:hypothetical protein